MTEVERKAIKSALLKCAKEQENRNVYTGEVVPSLICKSAVERIEELEKENKELVDKLNLQNQRLNELKNDNEYLNKVNDEQTERILDISDELKNEIAFNEESETVKKYKAQIEKMKNCGNCRFEYPICNECNGCGETYIHWELAE